MPTPSCGGFLQVEKEGVAEDVSRLLSEAGSVDLVSEQPNDLTEERVRQIDTAKSESSGEDADVPLRDKQDGSLRTSADVHTAIEVLSAERRLRKWTPRQSLIKLIIMLCLSEMEHVLATAKSLELNRNEISEAACYFAMKGKLIELTIVLMAFIDEAMGPVCVYEFEDYSISDTPILFRQFVRGELAALVDLEFYLMGRKQKENNLLFKLCKERQSAMVSTLPLLQLFDTAGVACH
ncbi:hypothetical protein ACH5RR_024623 [Cinchona calisaya]|uniref:Uncharacterized protein n=1 Tax=Cinchona calisaya TaxID=153742 RepID=A0ABD2YY53_9GENT